MRAKGIGYDTGFERGGRFNRPFDPDLVRRELAIIRDDLHCTAVRLIGTDLDRIDFAAREAAALGLEVWFSPFPWDRHPEEILALLADGAARAERLRAGGAEVVFVTGAELSLFNHGFVPGDGIEERVANLLASRELVAGLPAEVNEFLARAVETVRARFGGRITYASVPLERVDWTPFDIVSVDAHRSKEVAHVYRDGIRTLVAPGKPVAITEFGVTPYRGAADLGARCGEIVEYEGEVPVRLKGVYVRDEEEQAGYLRELLEVFTAEGVDAAFACTFVCYGLVHREDPAEDLDMASWGVVKVLEEGNGETYPDVPWEPKAAFRALAECYAGP
ncbi:hypothetical protein H4696_000563 [Amycolatopsis lexingtonensis]|uniref:Abortive infection protein n=1 Tax=Amycolatopsis lexingtonensis TaxID=218822 RepID=A0ABR9HRA5_9PSEU|nr:hypothetical protein [Amycolatopsis lexingtonensis]MBE1493463.1 hypothetical protein [Amycolatopsis lexingtonensis]